MVSTSDRPQRRLLTSVLRRLLAALGTLWAAVTLSFFALRVAGGDPTQSLLSQGLASVEQVAALRKDLGLDAPLVIQYIRYMGGLVRGDMGSSIFTQRAVAAVIAEQLPSSIELGLGALTISLVLGLALGVAAGWHPGRTSGIIAGGLSSLATGLPVAVLGLGAILVASAMARSIPAAIGLTSAGGLLLPSLTLGFAASGALARVIQAGLAETRSAPYLIAARARGIGGGVRLLWHALKPVLPLAVSLAALQAAFLLSGTVVTETVFSRPGLGRLLVTSILEGDFTVVQGIVVLAAAVYSLTQAAAEVGALFLDPRLREDR
jgi:ABC-type dipeptide/oligopeptide/nickel transport system permease component